MTEQAWIALIIGGGGIGSLITAIYLRKKTNADIGALASKQFKELYDVKDKEHDKAKLEIETLLMHDRIRERQHNDCEQRGRALELTLCLLQAKLKELDIDYTNGVTIKIFVLDDDTFVQSAFRKKLGMIPCLEVDTFNDIPEIVARIKERPQILLLDYTIHGMNIEAFLISIIDMKEYDPKIILITGMPKDKYEKWQFRPFVSAYFHKDDDYINKSVDFILTYVSEQVK